MTVSRTVSSVYLIGLVTVVKTVAIGVWLGFIIGSSDARGLVIGFGVLMGGLTVKHILTEISVNGLDLYHPLSPLAVILLSGSEAIVWTFWFLIIQSMQTFSGLLIGGVYLVAFLIPQHSLEDAIIRSERPIPDFLDTWKIVFSTVEATAATGLVFLVLRIGRIENVLSYYLVTEIGLAKIGLALLASLLFIEHAMNVHYFRRL